MRALFISRWTADIVVTPPLWCRNTARRISNVSLLLYPSLEPQLIWYYSGNPPQPTVVVLWRQWTSFSLHLYPQWVSTSLCFGLTDFSFQNKCTTVTKTVGTLNVELSMLLSYPTRWAHLLRVFLAWVSPPFPPAVSSLLRSHWVVLFFLTDTTRCYVTPTDY